MRTQLHLHRLRVLANHLNSVKVTTEYVNITATKFAHGNIMFFYQNETFLILPFFELELEHLFPTHFTKNYFGNMQFHMSPLYSIQYVLSWFFGLNIQEYENLFVVGKQRPELYRSNFLTASSSPKKCAYNIHKFIKSVEHEVLLENAKPRMVIVEKLRKDHPDHIFKTLEKL